MSVSMKGLKRCAGIYMALPLLLFIGGWLKTPVALVMGAAILLALWGFFKSAGAEERALKIPVWELALAGLIMLLWTHLGGFNGLFYQSNDWPWRNAIFHDLIDREWPVVYAERGTALTYYIGFWLPPALLGKIAGALCGEVMAWRVGRGALWLWTTLGLMLVWLMLLVWAEANTKFKRVMGLLSFVFFSGLDILGAIYSNRLDVVTSAQTLHLEWWMEDGKQFSSITTCLYWVFNQSVISWMAVMLFLTERDERNYVFIALACLCCGPLPCVGLIICMAACWIGRFVWLVQQRRVRDMGRSMFSLGNIMALAAVFPLVAYYLGNVSVVGTTHDAVNFRESMKAYWTLDLFVFYFVEAGVWLLLLGWERRRDVLFWTVAISLLFIPFFHVGSSEDFCMRASIPGVFILMAYHARYWCEARPLKRANKRGRLRCVAVLCAFLIGAATPALEIARGVYRVHEAGTFRLAQDSIGSIENLDEARNFTSENYEETLFFKMFAKR